MSFSFGHLVVVLLIVLVLFGAGRIPRVMGDFGKGIRALREGLKSEEDQPKALSSDKSDETKA